MLYRATPVRTVARGGDGAQRWHFKGFLRPHARDLKPTSIPSSASAILLAARIPFSPVRRNPAAPPARATPFPDQPDQGGH